MADKTILLTDDNPEITSTLESLLTVAGAQVRIARTYDEGLAALAEESITLAVVDIMLGEKSGLAMVREAKEKNKRIPHCVILTNSLKPEDVAEALELGITTFIQKADHDPAEIVDMIVKNLPA